MQDLETKVETKKNYVGLYRCAQVAEDETRVYYLYRHLRADSGTPFYIGIGKYRPGATGPSTRYSRANELKNGRSKYWRRIYEKHGCIVEIVLDELTKEEVIQKEIEFIALYGRTKFGGLLCNLTDGGEGVLGAKQSAETIEKRVSKLRGKKRPPMSQETRDKIGQAHKGRKKSPEQCVKDRDRVIRDYCRKVRCIETGEVFENRLEARDKLFPGKKSAHKSITESCIHRKPYLGFHFEYADHKDTSFLTVPKGSKHYNSKLTEDNVREVHRLKSEDNLKGSEIAKLFGVRKETINKILRGESWGWLK